MSALTVAVGVVTDEEYNDVTYESTLYDEWCDIMNVDRYGPNSGLTFQDEMTAVSVTAIAIQRLVEHLQRLQATELPEEHKVVIDLIEFDNCALHERLAPSALTLAQECVAATEYWLKD